MKKFSDDDIIAAAKNIFGIQRLSVWQRIVIRNTLDSAVSLENSKEQEAASRSAYAGESTDSFYFGRQIVLLQTGAGKSLCFLLPAMMLNGPTLVFYPLLALMADQARYLKSLGIECVIFRGRQSPQERDENFARIKNGAKIIIANPEVLQNENLLERLRECNICHIAIDEAHCVAEWGDTFRPAYLTLGKIIKCLGAELVSAFTATASLQILERIREVLFDGHVNIVRGEADRPNIHYYVQYSWAKKKAACRLAATQARPMLIFCGSRAKSEDMARELRECLGSGSSASSDKVRFYHAGLSRAERTKIEEWFFPNKDAILCCTCAFGMGIDKSDIRTVIHLEPSTTVESYVQETGRSGRDKKTAKAILLWSYNDSIRFEKFSQDSREYVIKRFAESKMCRRQVLLDALGGEQVLCSGCDICQGKAEHENFEPPTVFSAEDAKAVFRFIKKNKNYYNKYETLGFIKKKFNTQDRNIFSTNIWDNYDIEEILEQLEKSGAVYDAGFLWNHKLAAKREIVSIPSRNHC